MMKAILLYAFFITIVMVMASSSLTIGLFGENVTTLVAVGLFTTALYWGAYLLIDSQPNTGLKGRRGM